MSAFGGCSVVALFPLAALVFTVRSDALTHRRFAAVERCVACTVNAAMDLTTRERLVRLRVMLEEAERRSRDRAQIARHVATILLDGACEYAMGISMTHVGLSVPPRSKEDG